MAKFSYLLLPCFLIIGIIYTLIPKQLVIDGNMEGVVINTFTDDRQGGNSKIISFPDPSRCEIEYYVGDAIMFPFVGCGFFASDSSTLWDISSYDKMIIEIDPARSDDFNCMLNFFVPHFSTMNDGSTQQVLLTDVFVHATQSRYTISFKELVTPQWWYMNNKVTREEIPPLSYKLCAGIHFNNHPQLTPQKEYKILVKRVIFQKSHRKGTFLFTGVLLVYGIILLVRNYIGKRSTVMYEPITLTANCGNEKEILLQYLGHHYVQPDISLDTVVRETGIAQAKVRAILQKECQSSFKQYLNHLRITEAVRLIKETDNPISEIALSVGYRHVSTFNTIFKTVIGQTPSLFRITHKK